MIHKDLGLILKQIKYNDKSNIITILTRNYGKKSFLLFGINSRTKGKLLRNIINPLYPVNLVFYHKENQTLGKIKEISLAYNYHTVPTSFNKKVILLFLSEIINNALLEGIEDTEMFDFILRSIQILDMTEKNYTNFHILFIIKLLGYLGISPINNYSDRLPFFSIDQGHFIPSQENGITLDAHCSQIFGKLLDISISDFDQIRLDRNERIALLHSLVDYLSYHIDKFGGVKSLGVLEELFDESS